MEVLIAPKGPCAQILYTLALMKSLYRYFRASVYSIWVHGPLGVGMLKEPASLQLGSVKTHNASRNL